MTLLRLLLLLLVTLLLHLLLLLLLPVMCYDFLFQVLVLQLAPFNALVSRPFTALSFGFILADGLLQ